MRYSKWPVEAHLEFRRRNRPRKDFPSGSKVVTHPEGFCFLSPVKYLSVVAHCVFVGVS